MKSTLEDQLLQMALSIADNASSETQAGAVLVAKNTSADESARNRALICLILAGRHDLVGDIANDLLQRSQKGVRQAVTAEPGVPEIVQKGILSAPGYEKMCRRIERERARSDNAILMRALVRAEPITTAGADRLFTGITSGTYPSGDIVLMQSMSGKMGRERVELAMRLIRHDRRLAESVLVGIGGASPEYIRSYQGEILGFFLDRTASEKTRTGALVGLTNLGAEIPKEELLKFLEQYKSGEAATRVMLYLSVAKVKLTPEERTKFKSLVQNEEHKRWFDEAPLK